jgi:hypothetical protein
VTCKRKILKSFYIQANEDLGEKAQMDSQGNFFCDEKKYRCSERYEAQCSLRPLSCNSCERKVFTVKHPRLSE